MSFPTDPERFVNRDLYNIQRNRIMNSLELAPPDPSEDSTPIDPFQSTISNSQNELNNIGPDFEPQFNNYIGPSLPPGFEPYQDDRLPELYVGNSIQSSSTAFEDPEEPCSSRQSPPPPLPIQEERPSIVGSSTPQNIERSSLIGPSVPSSIERSPIIGPSIPSNLERSALIGPTLPPHLQQTQENNKHTSNEINDSNKSGPITSKDDESRLLQYRLNKRVESFKSANKREEWMTEPPKKFNNLILGARGFSKTNTSDNDDRHLWTDSPNRFSTNSTSTLKRPVDQMAVPKNEALEEQPKQESLFDLVKRKRQEEKGGVQNSTRDRVPFDYQRDIAGNGKNIGNSKNINKVVETLPNISSKFTHSSSKKYL
uniref:Uncharacterized protein n=1 Tax=Parastrongyloides trichosuri TaxID=131310 RepID=A0A0N4ZSM2_PARTI